MAYSVSIISSDIIGSNEDVFWQQLPDSIKTNGEVKLLVITSPIATGTTEETQLQKMLQACQLSTMDYYTLQLEHNIAWHKLKEVFKPKVVLLLGIMPDKLGISAMFRLFVPNSFDNCIWIPTLSLSDMDKQTDSKKQLWLHGLKPVFVDNTHGNI